jgi:hypothetical protein
MIEGETSDYDNLGKYCFVSCWTEDEAENIPLWNMYSKNMKGVRVKLPSLPFEKFILTSNSELKISIKNGPIETIIPFFYLIKAQCLPDLFQDNLVKIEYTSDKELLYPGVRSISHTKTHIGKGVHLSKIGIYKSKEWEFQKEWRYIVKVVPYHPSPNVMETYLENKHDPTIEYLDLKIDFKLFQEMEIMLGPSIDETERLQIIDMVSRYNPLAIVKSSKLSIRSK